MSVIPKGRWPVRCWRKHNCSPHRPVDERVSYCATVTWQWQQRIMNTPGSLAIRNSLISASLSPLLTNAPYIYVRHVSHEAPTTIFAPEPQAIT